MAFYHNQLREAAAEQFLTGKRGRARHAALASYFRGKADPDGKRKWEGGSVRGLGELPYHLAGAGEKRELFETLTDFTFLEHKVKEVAVAEHPGPDGTTTHTYAGVYQLQNDYEIAIEAFGGGKAGGRKPLIVTGTDFGKGIVLRCPWCNVVSPFDMEWRGKDIPCPNSDCTGPLRVNSFVVGK